MKEPRPRGRWTRIAELIVLLLVQLGTGAVVMVLELAAPRLLAPTLGTTTWVWAVVVATFLGGLAAGNAWGGRRADLAGRHVLPLLLVAAAAASALAPLVERATRPLLAAIPHLPRVLASVPLAFLPAAFLLGAVGPLVARALLCGSPQAGRVLGLASAAGAAGSVGGTFLAGFSLVPALGTRTILHGAALALLLLALLAGLVGGGAPCVRALRGPRSVPRATWAALAFLAGAALLMLEMLAGRQAAATLGNSLYAWTSVLGVTLGGLAVGAAAGGFLADRLPPRRLLAPLLSAAAIATLAALWADPVMNAFLLSPGPFASRALLAVLVPYGLPAALLGTLSPIVIRSALGDPGRDGRVVGGLYAAGTLGAVLGALAATTVVVPLFGIEGTVLALAATLALAAGLVQGRVPVLAPALVLAAALLLFVPHLAVVAAHVRLPRPWTEGEVRDSRYARIVTYPASSRWVTLLAEPDLHLLSDDLILGHQVSWVPARRSLVWEGSMSVLQQARLRQIVATDADREAVQRLATSTQHDVRVLRLDRLIHSYVDLQDPHWLGYEYERLYDAVTRHVSPAGTPTRALFLGGGGYAFPRHLLAARGDELRIITVEIDPEVTATAFAELGLEPDDRHTIVHEDARTYLDRAAAQDLSFDLVFGDAFNDLAVPFHLTTRECAVSVERLLSERGAYVVNVIDVLREGRFLGAFVATLSSVFPHVEVLSSAPRLDDVQDTFVVIAAKRPVELERLPTLVGPASAIVRYGGDDLDALRERSGGLVLTDDHAPVEILLAPVVEARDRPVE